ncbi:MAG: glycogen synthase, partial [Clostridia bacterium]|nr:glycogen synthase [Clostridia bacterium]
YYFIDNEYYFARDKLYGHFDDGERYAYFCMATMELIRHIGFYPDILHAHDWQSALSVVYLNTKYRAVAGYENIKTVFTIHNIEYQGKYDFAILGDVFDISDQYHDLMDWDGVINLMKAAIVCADKVSTVSPRYAEEIRTDDYGQGLQSILNENAYKLCGILNGIDYEYYDPYTDPVLAKNYSYRGLKGKKVSKAAFQKKYSLPEREDVPMLAVISRLASHKGLDLLCEIAYNLVSELDIQLVVLGKGESRYESFFVGLQSQFPDKVRALIEYDRDLSRQIYAASDIFIMPSKSEPCGLSQMIASRYGAIPVVRETGGLYDSIKGYWDDNGTLRGNGFTFANYRSDELYDRICAAVELWNDPDKKDKFIKLIMKTDFSWNNSAKKYNAMYNEVLTSNP